MIPVETVPGIGGGGMKESSGGVNSNMIYLIHCKNLCKCHNVYPPSRKIKNKYLFMTRTGEYYFKRSKPGKQRQISHVPTHTSQRSRE
jgi:hypothetical protein